MQKNALRLLGVRLNLNFLFDFMLFLEILIVGGIGAVLITLQSEKLKIQDLA
jgi:hypothetical protein